MCRGVGRWRGRAWWWCCSVRRWAGWRSSEQGLRGWSHRWAWRGEKDRDRDPRARGHRGRLRFVARWWSAPGCRGHRGAGGGGPLHRRCGGVCSGGGPVGHRRCWWWPCWRRAVHRCRWAVRGARCCARTASSYRGRAGVGGVQGAAGWAGRPGVAAGGGRGCGDAVRGCAGGGTHATGGAGGVGVPGATGRGDGVGLPLWGWAARVSADASVSVLGYEVLGADMALRASWCGRRYWTRAGARRTERWARCRPARRAWRDGARLPGSRWATTGGPAGAGHAAAHAGPGRDRAGAGTRVGARTGPAA